MAEFNNGPSYDTMEFLRIVNGAPAGASPAPSAGTGDGGYGGPSAAAASIPDPASGAAYPSAVPVREPEEPKPVVIKGGPRRVVRADGRSPETSYAMGQKRFSFSSGHTLFAPKKRRNRVRDALIALLALALVALAFGVAWVNVSSAIKLDKQQDIVDTTDYDGAISLTPSDDGGYYTCFLVTSDRTDEEHIGELSQVALYRYDKSVTQFILVHVPANLYVAPTSTTEARTLTDVLDTQSITRALKAVDAGLGTRIYNVVCCDQETFDSLSTVLSGSVASGSFDSASLLGRVYSNMSLDGLVELCGQIGALAVNGVRELTVPTTALDVDGVTMAQATSDTYRSALSLALAVPANAKYDENGNYAGTQYDENGNPLFDSTGAPLGALRDANGNLMFDENGYLQFSGQRYDENGWPVGTHYDENGNPILDEWGNPAGSQYTEDGSDFLYDETGSIIIL